MSDKDKSETTIRIRVDAKVGTDSRGRTVWTRPIEPVELELVSTAMLEQLLESGDESQTQQMRALADSGDGVLARNLGSNQYEIVSDAEFAAALKAAGGDGEDVDAVSAAAKRRAERAAQRRPEVPVEEESAGEGLSLVTTQVLRRILAGDDAIIEPDDNAGKAKNPGGYNPYDRG